MIEEWRPKLSRQPVKVYVQWETDEGQDYLDLNCCAKPRLGTVRVKEQREHTFIMS